MGRLKRAKVVLLGGRDCKLRTENLELKIGVGAEVGARWRDRV